MLVSDVQRCALPSWYADLTHLTFRTEFLELPADVLEYLRHKGSVIAPSECDQYWATTNKNDNEDEEEGEKEENETSEDDNEEEEEVVEERPSFPEFTTRMMSLIEELGGQVLPKLNWSSPRDATWLSMDNSLRCENPLQVYLLLKASDFVAHDLTKPFEHCRDEVECEIKYCLALRQWQSGLNASDEFRLFVRDKRMRAACQRDATHFNQHLVRDKEDILQDLKDFVQENRLSDIIGLNDFVLDVVRLNRGVVKLIDVNPFGDTTDSILFHWHELDGTNDDMAEEVELRLVTDEMGVQPNGLGQYWVPRDVLELSSSNADAEALVNLINSRAA